MMSLLVFPKKKKKKKKKKKMETSPFPFAKKVFYNSANFDCIFALNTFVGQKIMFLSVCYDHFVDLMTKDTHNI